MQSFGSEISEPGCPSFNDISAYRDLKNHLKHVASVANDKASVGTRADLSDLDGTIAATSPGVNFFESVLHAQPFLPLVAFLFVLFRLENLLRFQALIERPLLFVARARPLFVPGLVLVAQKEVENEVAAERVLRERL